MILFFLSSGLFLGWSLGANDAANVFGSAVGSKMVSFRKAVVILSVFVVVGAVVQGAGASHTLGKLGAVNAIAGSFTVALAAAITVFLMTKYKLPVSTSQAIVGAIIGWNLYSGNPTDMNSLTKIVATWALCPLLGAAFAILLHLLLKFTINRSKIHLLKLDRRLRIGLMLVGAFGSFSLGANNIANVMGVFVSAAAPEKNLDFGLFVLSGTQQLFLIGGLAIAIGAITYSKKIMQTVGNNILELSSESALVVVLAHSLVLFVFSSQALHDFMISIGLPPIPLVPVSSSQAIVGAILGVGLLKKAREINFGVLGGIATGWVTTPIIAGLISFFALFFVNNVFNQEVAKPNTDNLQVTENEIHVNNQKGENTEIIVLNDSVGLDRVLSNDKIIEAIDDESKKVFPIKRKDKLRAESHGVSNGSGTINIAKQFLVLIGSLILLLVIWILFYSYKRKKKEEKEILDKNDQIEETQKAYIISELENTKILNESLESELDFQKRELTNLALNLIKKNEFLEEIQSHVKAINKLDDVADKEREINSLLKQINQSLNIDRERKTFYLHVEEANNDFFLKLAQSFPALTIKEKQLAALLRLGLSSKDISMLQNISAKSVEMNRYRLRQKMNLESGDSLTEFINKI